MTYHRVCNSSNMTVTDSGAETYYMWKHLSLPPVSAWDSFCPVLNFLCNVMSTIVGLFVLFSLINIALSFLLRIMASDFLFGILVNCFWSVAKSMLYSLVWTDYWLTTRSSAMEMAVQGEKYEKNGDNLPFFLWHFFLWLFFPVYHIQSMQYPV